MPPKAKALAPSPPTGAKAKAPSAAPAAAGGPRPSIAVPRPSLVAPRPSIGAISTAAAKMLGLGKQGRSPSTAGDPSLYARYEAVLKFPSVEAAARVELQADEVTRYDLLWALEMHEGLVAMEDGIRAESRRNEAKAYLEKCEAFASGIRSIQQMELGHFETAGRALVADAERKGLAKLLTHGIQLSIMRVARTEAARRAELLAEREAQWKMIKKQLKSEALCTHLRDGAGGRANAGFLHCISDADGDGGGDDGASPVLNAINRRSSRQRSNSKALALQQQVMALAERSAGLAKQRGRTWEEERARAREEEDVLHADIALLEFKLTTETNRKLLPALSTQLEAKQQQLAKLQATLARYKEMAQREVERQKRCNLLLDADSLDHAVIAGEKNLFVRNLEQKVENMRAKEMVLLAENMRRMLHNHELPQEMKQHITESKQPSRNTSPKRHRGNSRNSNGGWHNGEEAPAGPGPSPPVQQQQQQKHQKDSAMTARHAIRAPVAPSAPSEAPGGRGGSATKQRRWTPETSAPVHQTSTVQHRLAAAAAAASGAANEGGSHPLPSRNSSATRQRHWTPDTAPSSRKSSASRVRGGKAGAEDWGDGARPPSGSEDQQPTPNRQPGQGRVGEAATGSACPQLDMNPGKKALADARARRAQRQQQDAESQQPGTIPAQLARLGSDDSNSSSGLLGSSEVEKQSAAQQRGEDLPTLPAGGIVRRYPSSNQSAASTAHADTAAAPTPRRQYPPQNRGNADGDDDDDEDDDDSNSSQPEGGNAPMLPLSSNRSRQQQQIVTGSVIR